LIEELNSSRDIEEIREKKERSQEKKKIKYFEFNETPVKKERSKYEMNSQNSTHGLSS
jgi:hypothetical protein